MLTIESIAASAPIARIASSRGRTFTPKTNTPVFVLDSAMQHFDPTSDPELLEKAILLSSGYGRTSVTSHTGELSEFAGRMAKRISFNLKQVRNVVNPLIRQIYERAELRRNDILSESPLNVNVIHLVRPAIYDNAAIENLLSVYEKGNFPIVRVGEGLVTRITSDLTAEVFLELYEGSSIKNVLKDIFADMDTFGGFHAGMLFPETPNLRSLYTDFSGILTFLFLKAANAGKLKHFNLADLESQERIVLSRAMGGLGKLAAGAATALDRRDANEVFILSAPENQAHSSASVFVLDSTYQKWIAGPGSLEALIGFVGGKGSDLGSLLHDPQVHVKEYERIAKLYDRKSAALSSTAVENLIDTELLDFLIEEYDDPKERAIHVLALRGYMKENRMYLGTDMYDYIARVTCEVLGRDYDAYLVHTDMRVFMDDPDNEDKDLTDAAAHSVIRLVGRWCASQVEVGSTYVDSSSLPDVTGTRGQYNP